MAKTTIIQASKDFTKRELYTFTRGSATKPMRDALDSPLTVKDWVVYEYPYTEEDGNETIRKAVTIVTDDNELFGSSAKPFVEAFEEIIDVLDGDPVGGLIVVEKESRNNRKYITCTLAI